MNWSSATSRSRGIVHLAGKEDSIRPGDRLGHELEVYADILAAYIQED